MRLKYTNIGILLKIPSKLTLIIALLPRIKRSGNRERIFRILPIPAGHSYPHHIDQMPASISLRFACPSKLLTSVSSTRRYPDQIHCRLINSLFQSKSSLTYHVAWS